jgi:hypothetical protein
MKSLVSILKRKTSSSQIIAAGVSSARIVYLANLAISEILGQNKSEAKAVYIKNQTLMIECKSSVIAQELRMQEEKILATFFVLGKRSEENPELLKQTLLEGHTLGLHSWDHPRFLGFRGAQIIENQIEKSKLDSIGLELTKFYFSKNLWSQLTH